MYCTPVEEQICDITGDLVVATDSECQSFTGCMGEDGPDIMNTADGTPCGTSGLGECNDGQCTEPPSPCDQVEGYNTLNRFCRLVQDQNQAECRYYVSGEGQPDDRITCNRFCEEFVGGTCIEGHNNPNNGDRSCNRDDRHGCNENYLDQICTCLID